MNHNAIVNEFCQVECYAVVKADEVFLREKGKQRQRGKFMLIRSALGK